MPEIDDEMKNWDEEEKRMEKLVVAKAKAEDYNTAGKGNAATNSSSDKGLSDGGTGLSLASVNSGTSSRSNSSEKDGTGLSLASVKSGGSARSNSARSSSARSNNSNEGGGDGGNDEAENSEEDADAGQDSELLRSASTKRLIAAELRIQVKRERVFRDAFALPPESPIVKKRSPFKDDFDTAARIGGSRLAEGDGKASGRGSIGKSSSSRSDGNGGEGTEVDVTADATGEAGAADRL